MFKKKVVKESLFIRTLQWASNRGSVGFKMQELRDAVIENEEEWIWVKRMMFGEINGDAPLICHLGGHHKGDGEYSYFLTGSGASALMDYIELKEARQNAKSAMRWAVASFTLAVIVGLAQILVSLYG
jgi:hypothetical protein